METKQSSNDLPKELVAKIIAMMPFPSIFKARLLSKSWLERFSSLEPKDDKLLKYRATRFQAERSPEAALQDQEFAAYFRQQVVERAANWESRFPVKFGTSDSWGYDMGSRTWERLPSLSFLPVDVWSNSAKITEGALLFVYAKPTPQVEMLYTANIYTRSWKVLPPRPGASESFLYHAHIVTDNSTQTYKIIVLSEDYVDRSDLNFIQTYDSKSNVWSSRLLDGSIYFGGPGVIVHLDRVLYRIGISHRLLTLDYEEGTVSEVLMSEQPDSKRWPNSRDLVVCKACLLLIVTEIRYPYRPTYEVFKIDLKSGRLVKIAQGTPIDASVYVSSNSTVGHGDCLYFGLREALDEALMYNLPKDEWGRFPLAPSPHLSSEPVRLYSSSKFPAFQPGLNVFMAV